MRHVTEDIGHRGSARAASSSLPISRPRRSVGVTVSYFLGLALCKRFAERLLNTPWLLHLDVFRPMLNPVLVGRSRPDLVGETTGGGWVALESRGRVSPPYANAKDKAKDQARRLVSVNGVMPDYQIGGVTYFRKDVLQFYWRDPEPDPNVRNPIKVTVEPDLWRNYYAPTSGVGCWVSGQGTVRAKT